MTGRHWAVPLLALAVSGCATLSGTHVERATTGEIVVRATSPMTFDEVAQVAYGDPDLGRTVARLTRQDYTGKVARGAVLVLPPRERLDAEVKTAEASDREFRSGLAAADAGSYRTAAAHFRRALEQDPDRLDIRYNLGLALLQAGELAEATSVLEAVAQARPNDPASRYAFGSVLRQRRAHRRALDEFEAALRADRDHADAAYARARTLEDLGETARAEKAWREFLSAFPDSRLSANAQRRLDALTSEKAARHDPGLRQP